MKGFHRASYVLFVLVLCLFSGCKKKKGAKTHKHQEMALRHSGGVNEYIFDEGMPVKDFAFVDEDRKEKSSVKYGSESDIANELLREELEDETLALSDYQDEVSEEFERINFEFNTESVLKGQQAKLHRNIETARKVASKDKEVEVRAYCCEMGPSDYNMALSQKRANVIKKEMVSHGVPSRRISAVGRGQEFQIAWSNAEERTTRIKELAPNRRVEMSASPAM